MTNGQSTTISLNNISHEKAKTEKNSWKYLLSKLECAYTLGTMLEMNLSLFHGFRPNRFGPETKPFQQRVTGHHPY